VNTPSRLDKDTFLRKVLSIAVVIGAALVLAAPVSSWAQKGPIALIGGGTFTDEHVLRSMGDEVLGVVTALHYSAALPNPANRKFVQAYEAKYKQIPSYYSEGSYVVGLALKVALDATGGDIENADKFLATLRRVDLSDAPRGPVRFDDFGNPVQNIHVRKVERVGGKLQNTVIFTNPQRLAVLDLQARGLPEEPRLLARLPAVHEVLIFLPFPPVGERASVRGVGL